MAKVELPRTRADSKCSRRSKKIQWERRQVTVSIAADGDLLRIRVGGELDANT